MNGAEHAIPVAKITWDDPESGTPRELILAEGETAGIGRLETNAICIKEQHVSRQHAVIDYRDGMFVITDLGSANGVFVNDQRLNGPYPLTAGDVIRLFVPVLNFSALVSEEELRHATEGMAPLTADDGAASGRLIITAGAQQGSTIPLLQEKLTIGRATSKADWEICLNDPSVSRPHARLERIDGNWVLYDLGSANGTSVNGTPVVNEAGRVLHDGDIVTVGGTIAVFHST